jgi:hypothetical protein
MAFFLLLSRKLDFFSELQWQTVHKRRLGLVFRVQRRRIDLLLWRSLNLQARTEVGDGKNQTKEKLCVEIVNLFFVDVGCPTII